MAEPRVTLSIEGKNISFLIDTGATYNVLLKFLDLNVKEKIIEDMRMTLEEQEQTQAEQDQVLEVKLEEAERLATGKTWLLKYLKVCIFFSVFS